jgi:FAD/FMN-containing dehydrogenase
MGDPGTIGQRGGESLASNQDRSSKSSETTGLLSSGVEELAFLGVQAKRVERPNTEREAQRILAQAFQDKLTVLPCGGGTAMGAGVLPESVDIALDMTGMNRILAFDPQNLNLAVLGGMTIDAINENLGGQGKGFFLPLDPPLAHRATIGGVYATNGSGPLRLRYGAIRDQVLGVRGADACGREVGFGGKTVKNVSGYDLTKFFIGSAGSLCLITSISFRVFPLPDASSLCELMFGSLEGLEKFLSALRSSVLIPSAVVVTDSAAAPVSGGRLRVLASFEGHSQAVDRQNKDLLKLAREFGCTGDARTERETMVKTLRSAIDPDGSTRDLLALKLSLPISQGLRTFLAVRKLSEEHGLMAKTALLAGNGVISICIPGADQERASLLIAGIKDIAQAAGGHITPIRGHRKLLSGWGPRVEAALHRFVLQPLKEKLDPTGVFPPII